MVYLGIDGGGSKTRFLLLDNTDAELACIETGPSNWSSVGPIISKNSIVDGIRQLPVRPDVVCGGFAGAARAEASWFYHHTIETLLPKAKILVETDAFVAYVGALGLQPGVLLIAGTGSIAIGRRRNGEMIRVGGWGPFFGDEGSGHWIGREAVRSALRAHDAGQHPEFVSAVGKALGVAAITDVISAWAANKIGPPAIAAVAPEVFRLYPAEPAARILKEAALHLYEIAHTAQGRINAPKFKTSIVGAVGGNPLIQDLIGIPFTPPQHSPERGAILWARTASADAK